MGRLILAALVAGLVVASLARAHGGSVVATGSNDAYKLTVQALDMRLNGEPAVDLTAYPVRRSNGAPDLDADVRFTLGTRTVPGRRQADGITAEIPIESTGSWRRQPIAVTVNGAAGTITVRAAAIDTDDGPPGWLIPATIAAILALGVVAFMRRRRPLAEA
jgi:MYXO-CTERM domain-containing protein